MTNKTVFEIGTRARQGAACCLLLAAASLAAAAPDYAREKRWADEVTPSLVVGDPIYLEQKNQHKFLGLFAAAPNARMGVVVVHGRGIHPDWGMVGTLRQRLFDFGYTTLSIQMPVLAEGAEFEAYRQTFPEAWERLDLAFAYLKKKGVKKIAIVSHSMGSRMCYNFVKNNPTKVNAWAALGIVQEGNFNGVTVPVLDLYGENDLPHVLANTAKRKAALHGNNASKQVVIPNADHFFAKHEEAMVRVVKDFLDGIK